MSIGDHIRLLEEVYGARHFLTQAHLFRLGLTTEEEVMRAARAVIWGQRSPDSKTES